MAKPYFYEFFWRGYPDGTGAYHIVMRSESKDGFGDPVSSEKVFNMAQATEAGIDLPAALAEVNKQTLAGMDQLTAENAALSSTITDLAKQNDDLQAELVDLRAREAARAAIIGTVVESDEVA